MEHSFQQTAQSVFDSIPNENLVHILSFLDFQNMFLFSKQCSKALSQRILKDTSDFDDFHVLWKTSFHRQKFFLPSPQKDRFKAHDYFSMILKQKKYQQSIQQKTHKEKKRIVRGISDKFLQFYCFYSPADNDSDNEFQMSNTVPPIDFVGELFALVDGGIDGEIVCMDPFDGTISVKHLEKYYNNDFQEVLFSLKDYEEDTDENTEDMEVYVDWIGVERKLCRDRHKMIVAVRAKEKEERIMNMDFNNDSSTNTNNIRSTQDWKHSMEILAWKETPTKSTQNKSRYQNKLICRVGGVPYYIDTCGQYDKVYAVFSPEDRSAQTFLGHIPPSTSTHQQTENNDNSRQVIMHSNAIYQFPLLPSHQYSSPTTTVAPEKLFLCKSSIASFSIDSSGEHIVIGTDDGTVEIWNTGLKTKKTPFRLQILKRNKNHHKDSVLDEDPTREFLIPTLTPVSSQTGNNSSTPFPEVTMDRNAMVPQYDFNSSNFDQNIIDITHHNGLELQNDLNQEVLQETTPISRIILSLHLPISSSGFCTFQSKLNECTLWQSNGLKSEEHSSFQQTGILSFPHLNDTQINFNGKRIILFGRDKIGFVIYIYLVWNNHEDDYLLQANSCSNHDKTTPAVHHCLKDTNKTRQERIQYVNTIRHASLGGLEVYESLILSSNERYIVVNTKKGNLMRDEGFLSDGLWAVDLIDASDNIST